jgi:hypothetical protein
VNASLDRTAASASTLFGDPDHKTQMDAQVEMRTMSTRIAITVADCFQFVARMEDASAPATCAAFQRLLPYTQRVIHCRWSGEGCWIPLGGLEIGVGEENSKSTPGPGEVLFHPGGISETEVLIPYGDVAFACRAGPLAGNHFLTIVEGIEKLPELGRRVLYHGAQEIRFTLA